MSGKLFFIKQKTEGLEQHRWILYRSNDTLEYSDFYPNKAATISNCIDTIQTSLLDDVIFENMTTGMVSLITNAVRNRYGDKGVNYFDECSEDSHEPGCMCQGKRTLEETEEL